MKIVVAGNYGAGNLGDEIILEGLLNSLKNCSPKAKITVLKGDQKFPSGLKSLIKSIFNPKRKTAKTVKACDYFILGGGGLFGSLTFRANIIWGIQAFMAYLYKKPVIMYGQGIGELKGKFRKWLVKYLFQKAKLIAVRDQASKNRLKLLGVNKKIYVIPDLAFNIPYKPHKKSKKTLILALRQKPNISKEFIIAVSKYLNWIINEKKWKVKIINFQSQPSKDADEIIHNKIIQNVSNKKQIKIIPTPQNSVELFDLYSSSGLILGMRLHSIIAAIKTEKPFIALSYAPKIRDILKESSLEQYMIKADGIDSKIQLIKSTEVILGKTHQIKQKLAKINQKYLLKHKEMEALNLCKTFSNEH
jgi:polysaccharide pyruvyl transferase CsaB